MLRRLCVLVCVSSLLCSEEEALVVMEPQLLAEPVVAEDADLPVLDVTTSEEVAFVELTSPPLSLPPDEALASAPVEIKKTKSPFVAVLLSGLVPGLGHYYLGETQVANELLGGTVLGGIGAFASRSDPSLFITSLFTIQAVSAYSVYAAYRDAKMYNGNASAIMPRENFKELSAAPFQWSVLKKPEVWGGLLGTLTAGISMVYFAYPEASARIDTTYIEPLSALPIALGEESLFRGLIQTSLMEKMPPWGAIALSSLVFGAAHIPNATIMVEPSDRWRYYTFTIPFLTSLGAYMGWLTYKNRSLKESVALHMWYDFTLMCAATLANKAAIGGESHFAYGFEF